MLLPLMLGTAPVPFAAAEGSPVLSSSGESWYFGFGRRQITPDANSNQPLYIAGYNSGWEITGI